MNPPFDPKRTLEWLYQKRDEINAVIVFMERQVPLSVLEPQLVNAPVKIEIVPLEPQPQKDLPCTRIKPGQFENMRIWEAARAFLAMTKAPQSTKQIATCLIRGGISSQAKHLETNLYTVLKNKPKVFQKTGPSMWGLAQELG